MKSLTVSILLLNIFVLADFCMGGVSLKECDIVDAILPIDVRIGNCTTEDLCYVNNIAKLDMEMTFNSPGFLASISPKLTGITALGNITFTISEEEQDACTGLLNTLCPLVAQENVQYKIDITFIALSNIPVNLQFELINDISAKTVLCFRSFVIPQTAKENDNMT